LKAKYIHIPTYLITTRTRQVRFDATNTKIMATTTTSIDATTAMTTTTTFTPLPTNTTTTTVHPNVGPQTMGTLTPLFAIALLVYTVRIWTRVRPKSRLNAADYMITVAMVCKAKRVFIPLSDILACFIPHTITIIPRPGSSPFQFSRPVRAKEKKREKKKGGGRKTTEDRNPRHPTTTK